MFLCLLKSLDRERANVGACFFCTKLPETSWQRLETSGKEHKRAWKVHYRRWCLRIIIFFCIKDSVLQGTKQVLPCAGKTSEAVAKLGLGKVYFAMFFFFFFPPGNVSISLLTFLRVPVALKHKGLALGKWKKKKKKRTLLWQQWLNQCIFNLVSSILLMNTFFLWFVM